MPYKKKDIKYETEQKNILTKLLNILEYDISKTFLLYDLDNDLEKQEKIKSLCDDIKKYYPSSSCIGTNGKKCNRPYLSIIRYILKHNDMKLFSMNYAIPTENKKYIRTKQYTII
jgi:hypothetical protein